MEEEASHLFDTTKTVSNICTQQSFPVGTALSLSGTHKGKPIDLKAGKEVILSAGSIASPMILQRSGVGPGALLQRLGIPVAHELAGVGQNLQDHLEVYFQFHCKQPVSLNSKLNPFSKFLIGARWFFFKSGLGATNHFESCAFIRSRPGIEWPDIQYHFLPAAMRYDGPVSAARGLPRLGNAPLPPEDRVGGGAGEPGPPAEPAEAADGD